MTDTDAGDGAAPGPATEAGRSAVRYETLMGLCREAFTDRRYDAAYHALAAALHSAGDLADAGRIADVGGLAREQIGWIDRHAPAYHHSTASCARRGHASPLATLGQQSDARLLILRGQGVIDRRRAGKMLAFRQEKVSGPIGLVRE